MLRSNRFLFVSLVLGIAALGCGGDESTSTSSNTGGNAGTGGNGGSTSSGNPSGTGGNTGTGGSVGGGSISDCKPYTPGDNLDVCTASYLGGAMADKGAAIDIGNDDAVIVAGTLAGNDFGLTPIPIMGGTSGAVLRLSSDGKGAASITRIGQSVSDMEVDRTSGNIAVTGDFGAALLDGKAQGALWQKTLDAPGERISVGADGTVAALAAKKVTVWDKGGTELASFSVSGSMVNDVAVDSARSQVLVTGFKQDDGAPCTQLQIAFVRAYDYMGQLKWKSYDWTRTEVGAKSLCADTRGDRVAVGRDGKLYFTGESAGGNTIYQKLASSLDTNAPNVKFDKYNDPYNTASNHITYYAELDPMTGDTVKGQFLLSRLSSGKGNTIKPRSITADEKGNVFVGGISTCCIEHRGDAMTTTLSISGQQVGAYGGADNFVLIASPDFKKRLTWTTWSGASHAEETTGVAAAKGIAAMVTFQVATELAKGPLVSVDPLQSMAGGDAEAFISVWPAP